MRRIVGEPSYKEGFPHTPSKKSQTIFSKANLLHTDRQSARGETSLWLPQAARDH